MAFIINSFNNRLEPPVRDHLKNVYSCLVMSNLAAAIGASIPLFSDVLEAGLVYMLSSIGAMIFFLLLVLSPDDEGKKTMKRLGYLFGFSVLSGFGIGPWLQIAILIDPSIVVSAFLLTSVVFISFTICAIFSERGQWVYLGGILFTFFNIIILMSLANIIFGSTLLWEIQVYLELIVLCGFILYETQAIIEKRRMGSRDVAAHSLDLFISVFGIFKNILIILSREAAGAIRSRDGERREDIGN